MQKGAALGPWISGKSDQHNVWKSLKELFVKQLHSDAAPNENLGKRTECQFSPSFFITDFTVGHEQANLLCEEDMLGSAFCKHWEMELQKRLCFGEFYIYFAQNARKLTELAELTEKQNLEYEIDNLTYFFLQFLDKLSSHPLFLLAVTVTSENSQTWSQIELGVFLLASEGFG